MIGASKLQRMSYYRYYTITKKIKNSFGSHKVIVNYLSLTRNNYDNVWCSDVQEKCAVPMSHTSTSFDYIAKSSYGLLLLLYSSIVGSIHKQ